MNWFTQKVKVTLIDDATDAAFATTEMPPTDLPESFAIETMLHIGGSDWSVVHATPVTRAEYERSGTLTLRLRRVKMVNPKEILFSLPSICDRLPAVGDLPLNGDECTLAEDDWRQVEFVSRPFANESDTEIDAIRTIHQQEWANPGWRRIHVRRRPDPPIVGLLTLSHLKQAFGGSVEFRGVAIGGSDSPIISGFSFRTADGLECYGIAEEGNILVLGIAEDRPDEPPLQSADVLTQVAKDFELDLVHWCRCARASSNDPLFRRILLDSDAE